MLQHIAKRLGAEVLLTPKCHAKLAWKGVEYIWGGEKGEYWRLSLAEKRGKDNFKASLHHCLSEEVITVKRVRKTARRARQYLMAYHAIDLGQVNAQTHHDCLKYGPVAVDKFLINNLKPHRCALDFDYKFIMEAWSDEVFLFLGRLCDNSLVCKFCRVCFQNMQHRVFLYAENFRVLTIDEFTTKFIWYESYGGYPKYLLFAPSHRVRFLTYSTPSTIENAHSVHRRREVPNLKIIIGVRIGQKKNVVKSFSAFIVLKKFQFASKSMRIVQLVYQIGVLTLLKIPYCITTFRASHHQIPFWELCDVWLTSSTCTNLLYKLWYQRISMWIPDWYNKVHQLIPQIGTFILIQDRFQIGFFYDYNVNPIWEN